jgi:hypothetical protein
MVRVLGVTHPAAPIPRSGFVLRPRLVCLREGIGRVEFDVIPRPAAAYGQTKRLARRQSVGSPSALIAGVQASDGLALASVSPLFVRLLHAPPIGGDFQPIHPLTRWVRPNHRSTTLWNGQGGLPALRPHLSLPRRRGADLLLQVRCAVYNGTLGSEFGQKFHPANDSCPPTAVAA